MKEYEIVYYLEDDECVEEVQIVSGNNRTEALMSFKNVLSQSGVEPNEVIVESMAETTRRESFIIWDNDFRYNGYMTLAEILDRDGILNLKTYEICYRINRKSDSDNHKANSGHFGRYVQADCEMDAFKELWRFLKKFETANHRDIDPDDVEIVKITRVLDRKDFKSKQLTLSGAMEGNFE